MQDNELPPIEGELTDEELMQVSGGDGAIQNGNVVILPEQAKPVFIERGEGPFPHPGNG
jgi:bacteriocin-like protein